MVGFKWSNDPEYTKFINSIGISDNPNAIESISFFTVSSVKFPLDKDSCLFYNDLTSGDTVVFTTFMIRAICSQKIIKRKNIMEFDKQYISKVLDYYPEFNEISKKYNCNFFTERISYYDKIFSDNFKPIADRLDATIQEFEAILTYDLDGEYVKYDENSPIRIIDIFDHFRISSDVKNYCNKIFQKYTIDGFKAVASDFNR